MENAKCCQSESLIQVNWDGKNLLFEPVKGPEKQQAASISRDDLRALNRFGRF
jgi:hypothetical protein